MTGATDFADRGMQHDDSSRAKPDLRVLDWDALRERLEQDDRQPVWRSLDELSDSPEFLDYLGREFPRLAGEWTDPTSRRTFLQRMGASLALAGIGLSGCMRQPDEKIVPYVRQPEDVIPGIPQYFATCMTLGGFATGLLVESHLNRPTKIEGNPDHPASLGATDVYSQAQILSLYDPDRSQTIMHGGKISTWGAFLTELASRADEWRRQKGQGLAILTETVTSPTLGDQLASVAKEFPESTWYQFEPVSRDNVRAGARLAFGKPVDTTYHFDKADIIVSLDAEFLVGMPGSLRYVRQFIDRRRLVQSDRDAQRETDAPATMNRLYAVESTPGLTGAQADHRLPLKARDVEPLTRAIAAEVGVDVVRGSHARPSGVTDKWFETVVSELKSHRGKSLVVAGDGQPAIVHALAHAINRELGNVGQTVEYIEPVEARPDDQLNSLTGLVGRMNRDEVKALFVLGGNPVYNTPHSMGFAKAYERVEYRVHLSLEYDETSFDSHWHISAAHSLESWSDARAYDGTATIQQPLIAPMYGGRTDHEVIAAIVGHAEISPYQIVRKYWKTRLAGDNFEDVWSRSVHDGVIPSTRGDSQTPDWKFVDQIVDKKTQSGDESHNLEITFCPDPTIWDGRFANNGWLQELPKPITKLTWDNAALISPRTAERLQIANHEVLELSLSGRTVRAPAWIVPGQPDDSISLSLGYGRTRSGRNATGIGVNACILRPAVAQNFASGLTLKRTGQRYGLAVTQHHHNMQGRDLVPSATLAEFKENPEFLSHERRFPHEFPTLYPKADETPYGWGMIIDQTACIGCNACVVACQAENNVPIVGKEQVGIGREMHWLRIDRYYRGEIESPQTDFQPMMCVHCENAPCELVCPVAATVHSHDGLNQMVYNRCVGTRYCSNNCPYKVRRFNFLEYNSELGYDGERAPSLALMRNPDVTVRSRGVMEKCTYCVQRIRAAKIDADKDFRSVNDGEIKTACEQACPAQAIRFGNVRDPASQVSQMKESPLNYSVLAELNTRPRTTHLARIRNPRPDLDDSSKRDTPTIDPSPVDRREER